MTRSWHRPCFDPSYDMQKDIPEKIVILILSGLLLTGSFILYRRHSRPLRVITVEEGGIQQELTMEEVRSLLKESRRVNINTAGAEDLTMIPGIGPVTAARIVEFRENTGRFTSPESLLNVKGIGPATLEKMREYIKTE